jgi:hypothetical protein
MEAQTLTNRIHKVIQLNESKGLKFKPSHQYFKSIGINKHLFHKIIRNEKQPDLTQLGAIASSLGVTPIELIEGMATNLSR